MLLTAVRLYLSRWRNGALLFLILLIATVSFSCIPPCYRPRPCYSDFCPDQAPPKSKFMWRHEFPDSLMVTVLVPAQREHLSSHPRPSRTFEPTVVGERVDIAGALRPGTRFVFKAGYALDDQIVALDGQPYTSHAIADSDPSRHIEVVRSSREILVTLCPSLPEGSHSLVLRPASAIDPLLRIDFETQPTANEAGS